MINLNYLSSLLNKTVSFLLALSLLAATFSFAADENVKQDFSILYKATSICEYYSSLANFSYEMIDKVLKSANINLSYSSTKTNSTNNKKKNKQNTRFDFVEPNNENDIKNLKSVNLYYGSVLFFENSFKIYTLENIISINNIFVLLFLFFGFCYFARGNIEDNIKFYKKIKDRLV